MCAEMKGIENKRTTSFCAQQTRLNQSTSCFKPCCAVAPCLCDCWSPLPWSPQRMANRSGHRRQTVLQRHEKLKMYGFEMFRVYSSCGRRLWCVCSSRDNLQLCPKDNAVDIIGDFCLCCKQEVSAKTVCGPMTLFRWFVAPR